MADWNPALYTRFEDERTRPAAELLARVPLDAPRLAVDLGCGPGNSTALIAARFPDAEVIGLDTSPAMLESARARLPGLSFALADAATWVPERAPDLIYANAVLQWLPDHATLLPRLFGLLAPGGVLAVQMPNNLSEPSHVSMDEAAAEGPWAGRLANARASKAVIGSFSDYRRWLMEAGCEVDIWQTTYVHALAGHDAIVEWFKSTGLKPYIDPLPADEREAFLALYREKIAAAYPVEPDGKVLLRFPRLFILAAGA